MSNTEPTRDEVMQSIVPRSDQLNADDLLTGPITVAITKVRRGDKEQPIVVEIEGHRPYKPCKTCRRILIAAFSDDPKHWIGQRMTLFCDPSVMFGGVKVGGIRISHLSGIDTPQTYLMTTGRGKRSEVTIMPLPPATDGDAAFIEDARGEIERAASLEALKAVGFILKKKSKAVQDALRSTYAARQKELTSEAKAEN